MATTVQIALAALDDLPARGQTVSRDVAVAYRCARRMLQPLGGLSDVIEPTDDVEWPEETYTSVDLREYLGRDMGAQDLAELESLIVTALSEEDEVDDAVVTAAFSGGTLSAAVDATGADGPFSFVLSVSDVSSATLQVE
jgi:hypothetical protein